MSSDSERRPSQCFAAGLAALASLLGGCGVQGMFASASSDTGRVASLFWVMTAAGAVIWLVVVGLAVYATRLRPGAHPARTVRSFVLGGGVILPVVLLAILLGTGLSLLPQADAARGALRISVTGERWWWRVHYRTADGREVALANELRLPQGQAVEVELRSPEVVHSFWVPSLAGKLDMIPGRVNRLVLEPSRLGRFRGQCAEFCGTGHANMAFIVEVLPAADFSSWLAAQAAPARPPSSAAAERGEHLFLQRGCALCHSVRGTAARGSVGPDLTHVGSRHTLAAGVLPREPQAFVRWIAGAERIKPGTRMPSYDLPEEELVAMARYLEGLQ